ncbi:MAG: NADH-quinone oxidoreductase subunit L [Armatimonadota bacterium]|nr:NADH-quinone oxidoreductase subunit L [Armatimonadota bacterium]
MSEYAWLIPLIPFLAFVAIIFAGRRLPGHGAYVAIAGMSASLLISLVIAAGAITHGGHFEPVVRTAAWIPYGYSTLNVGFTVDALAIVMLIVVTVVALMVQVYSIGYMHGDARYPRFFAFLSMFSAAMLGLVLANNLLVIYICWELVGLCSYLLIGFWFERPTAMRAAKKAFLVTRVGDVGLFLGMLTIYMGIGSLDLQTVLSHESVSTMAKTIVSVGPWALPLAALASLGIFWGAVGKSAQFPLHVWLPDAMEGPTPVSALIHAATMVAAGVYLVARTYPLFAYSDHSISLNVVAYTGAITALMAATIGFTQYDIKRVLAYSTISQLGFMMMGLGVGGYVAGMFHLMTHAFFKANLFLGSGSVIHGTGTQDIREMGGLKKHMPRTFWTFIIATAALAGIFPLAGFWSKDEILLTAFHADKTIFYAGVIGAFMTAFYMSRLCILTFLGEPRDEHIHAHESPRVMTVPLIVLAFLAVVAGWVGLPGKNLFAEFLHTDLLHLEHHAFSLGIAAVGTAVALFGVLLAYIVYMTPASRTVAALGQISVFRFIHSLVYNKYWLDEIYGVIIIRPLFAVTRWMFAIDRWIIDGTVNAVGWLTVAISRVQGWVDKWIVDGLVNLIGIVTRGAGLILRRTQTGVAQQYAMVMLLGLLALVYFYLIRAG